MYFQFQEEKWSDTGERFTDNWCMHDATIFAESMEDLIGAFRRLSEESEYMGLQVSRIKTKTQVFMTSWVKL